MLAEVDIHNLATGWQIGNIVLVHAEPKRSTAQAFVIRRDSSHMKAGSLAILLIDWFRPAPTEHEGRTTVD